MDPAVSEWFQQDGTYFLPKAKKNHDTGRRWSGLWKDFASKYPIISLKTAWPRRIVEGWKMLTTASWATRSSLWATTCSCPTSKGFQRASSWGGCQPILIKLQPLRQTLNRNAKPSRRPTARQIRRFMCFPSLGETEDTTIADIRRGAQRRADQDRPRPRALTDRVGMYNQLLLIEE